MSDTTNPYQPIAVGFFLLAVPLVAALFLAEAATGRWTNAVAAAVMVGFGLLLWLRGGRS